MNILVFEQNGSGAQKISGIKRFGNPDDTVTIVDIDARLPEFVDEPEDYIDEKSMDGDLVLNYLTHPDLSHYLIELCTEKKIPIVSSGKHSDKGYTPFTCCGLGRHKKLGSYGEYFGFPEYRVELEGEIIRNIQVIRGAPCGATWDTISEVIGVPIDEAMSLLPRLVQYHCTANPGRFDPITGKSPVHYAGYVHRAALKKAIDQARG
jgi:hypothetical protein